MKAAPFKLFLSVLHVGLFVAISYGQDLTPRAYTVTPTRSNAILLTYSFFDGSVFTDPTAPITDSKARYSAQVFSYYRAFGFFGRAANVTGSLPYVLGNFRGTVSGSENQIYRSGLADCRIRFAVNLRGGPAMRLKEFSAWRQKSLLGVSLTVVAPTGQYDPVRLINPSIHRWAVKSELGFSRRWDRWTLDLYGGVWFFTANGNFYPGISNRSQKPVGVGETHLSYNVTPRLWVSLDGNFWTGGRTTVNGTEKADYQKNSRVGATVAIPLNQHQSLKFSYSRGAYISIGGDYQNVSIAWQYSWVGAER
jgi:hypothetical protein